MEQPSKNFLYLFQDYDLLSGRRSYPRYQAMILFHLLSDAVTASLDEASA